MYTQVLTSAYKRDLKKIKHNKQLLFELDTVVRKLLKGETLPYKYKDHKLTNSKEYIDCRECHIRPDCLLVYQVVNDKLVLKLLRVGSHSDIFESFELRESDETNAMMDVMKDNDKYKDDPYVGCFWYDPQRDELFGVYSVLADDAPMFDSKLFNTKVRTGRKLHKDIWNKEQYKGKDKRFKGDHTLIPRGRVFQLEDGSFKVMVGDWIDEYPQCKDEVIYEFQLPEDTEFVKDNHWNIGRGFSDEFLED